MDAAEMMGARLETHGHSVRIAHDAGDAGFDTHLTKPADPDLILAAIASVEPV